MAAKVELSPPQAKEPETSQAKEPETAQTSNQSKPAVSSADLPDAVSAMESAISAAKDDLKQKLFLAAQPNLLESAGAKSMLVSWYVDNTCSGAPTVSSVVAATTQCVFLPGYGVPAVKSAIAECSFINDRGVVTFYDTPCDTAGSSRAVTINMSPTNEGNCVQFPGETSYAKIIWCNDDPNSGATTVGYSGVVTVLAVSLVYAMKLSL